jgi:hypothetical protein
MAFREIYEVVMLPQNIAMGLLYTAPQGGIQVIRKHGI